LRQKIKPSFRGLLIVATEVKRFFGALPRAFGKAKKLFVVRKNRNQVSIKAEMLAMLNSYLAEICLGSLMTISGFP